MSESKRLCPEHSEFHIYTSSSSKNQVFIASPAPFKTIIGTALPFPWKHTHFVTDVDPVGEDEGALLIVERVVGHVHGALCCEDAARLPDDGTVRVQAGPEQPEVVDIVHRTRAGNGMLMRYL